MHKCASIWTYSWRLGVRGAEMNSLQSQFGTETVLLFSRLPESTGSRLQQY